MIKRFAALMLATAMLTGCTVQYRVNQPRGTAAPAPVQPPEPTPEATPKNDEMGSVGLLTEPTVLVSVYLQNGQQSWTDESIARSRENLEVAVDWLCAQAAEYGVESTLYFDDGTHPDLHRARSWSAPFVGGTEADEGDKFYDAADLWCDQTDVETLEKTYGTDRIGFLYFLPDEGCDHTMIHMAEDGEYYYYEYCVLYENDCYEDEDTFDSPTAYAHELLHLFGAVDLYEGTNDNIVTDELRFYVEEHWPDAIMLDTYDGDDPIDYEAIHKNICPVTLYRVGLVDSFEQAELFPAVAECPPGVFTYGDYKSEGALDAFGSTAVAVKPERATN